MKELPHPHELDHYGIKITAFFAFFCSFGAEHFTRNTLLTTRRNSQMTLTEAKINPL